MIFIYTQFLAKTNRGFAPSTGRNKMASPLQYKVYGKNGKYWAVLRTLNMAQALMKLCNCEIKIKFRNKIVDKNY